MQRISHLNFPFSRWEDSYFMEQFLLLQYHLLSILILQMNRKYLFIYYDVKLFSFIYIVYSVSVISSQYFQTFIKHHFFIVQHLLFVTSHNKPGSFAKTSTAQLVERQALNLMVEGSSPSFGENINNTNFLPDKTKIEER